MITEESRVRLLSGVVDEGLPTKEIGKIGIVKKVCSDGLVVATSYSKRGWYLPLETVVAI